MNIEVHIFFELVFWDSLEIFPVVGLLGHKAAPFLIFWGNSMLFSTVWNRSYLLSYIKGWDIFFLCSLLADCPWCASVWCNAYSIIKVFSFSTIFMERFSGLGRDFIFNYIFLSVHLTIYLFTYHFIFTFLSHHLICHIYLPSLFLSFLPSSTQWHSHMAFWKCSSSYIITLPKILQ